MPNSTIMKTFDYKGLCCPIPVVRLSMEMKNISIGDTVEVITTDPSSISEFPAWAKVTGQSLIETKQDHEVIKFIIKRLK
jgi:tRNA 2-thiouridine synthesizing protein A